MRRFTLIALACTFPLLGAATASRDTPAVFSGELELRVESADPDSNVVVRVAVVAGDSTSVLDVFERRTPFTWRVPRGAMMLLAQHVGRTAAISVEMAAVDTLGMAGGPSISAGGKGRTIVLGHQLGSAAHFVSVLP